MSKELEEQIREYAKKNPTFTLPKMLDELYPNLEYWDRQIVLRHLNKTINMMEKWGKAERIEIIQNKETHGSRMVLWGVVE